MQKKKFKDIKKILIACIVVSLFAVLVFGCAPAQSGSDTSGSAEDSATDTTTDNGSTATVAFTMDIDCGICHTDQQATLSDTAISASVHAANGSSCITCHDDEASLTTAHASASAAGANDVRRLKNTNVSLDLCTGCHANYKELTADTPPLVDSKGTSVDPHNYPSTDGHRSINCLSCHIQHSPAETYDNAEKLCMSCHHDEVFECDTCH